MTPAPDWLRRQPVAHRGLHESAAGRPENSLAAFAAACEAGYAIELDVRRSADGVAMVFHDERLARMTGADGGVAELAATELGRLRLAGGDQHMPTLGEVAALVDGRVPLLVEIKSDGRDIGALEAATWAVLRSYRGPYAVQSFNPWSVAWFRDHAPDAPRGQLSGDWRRYDGAWSHWQRLLLRRLLLNGVSRPCFVAYDVRALPYWAPALARRLGLPVLAWTVRTEADRLVAAGNADNIIFEDWRPSPTPAAAWAREAANASSSRAGTGGTEHG